MNESRKHWHVLANLLRRPSCQTVLLAVVTLAVVCCASDAVACPTCKDGIAENDPAAQSMAAGYFYSILFMMSMPFLILGTFGSFAYLSIRKANNQAADTSRQS